MPQKYDPNEFGTWIIFMKSNCENDCMIFEKVVCSKYRNAVAYALDIAKETNRYATESDFVVEELPADFIKYVDEEYDSKNRSALNKEKQELLSKLEQIENELKSM